MRPSSKPPNVPRTPPAIPENADSREQLAWADDAAPGLFRNPRSLFLLLGGYFLLQVVLRTVMSSSVDLDESEQVVLGQQFCWGYGSDPPLYTWLQIPFFRMFGESVLALSLLKNALLFSVYALTFLIGRNLTGSSVAAATAALSLFFLPSLAWESQRDLTHTILAAMLALTTLLALVRVCETRKLRWYLAFGAAAGLGLISKYNYAVWLVGLVLAAASLRELRPALLDKRMFLALALAMVLFLPNGLWVLRHPDLALLTSSKFEIAQAPAWFTVVRTGLKNILQSLASFVGPITLIYLLLFLRRPAQPLAQGTPNSKYQGLMVRAWILIGVILLLLVLLAHATGFKERWFQPLLICIPVLAASVVQGRLDRLRLSTLALLSILVMLSVAVVMPGRLLAAERLRREEPLTRPYRQLAAQIGPGVPEQALVICDTRLLAGNLRLGLPQARVLPPELVPLLGGKRAQWFLIWDARKNDLPPEELGRWVEKYAPGATARADRRYFTALYRHHHTKEYRLGVLQLR